LQGKFRPQTVIKRFGRTGQAAIGSKKWTTSRRFIPIGLGRWDTNDEIAFGKSYVAHFSISEWSEMAPFSIWHVATESSSTTSM
jgi:hypothetical protein